MKTTTALIIESSDWTKDGNLKKEAFLAMGDHPIVISEGRIIKGVSTEPLQKPQEPVKRVHRAKAADVTPTAPQEATGPQDEQSQIIISNES